MKFKEFSRKTKLNSLLDEMTWFLWKSETSLDIACNWISGNDKSSVEKSGIIISLWSGGGTVYWEKASMICAFTDIVETRSILDSVLNFLEKHYFSRNRLKIKLEKEVKLAKNRKKIRKIRI